jgi:hypothetical protein
MRIITAAAPVHGPRTATTTNFRIAAAIPIRYRALTYVRLRRRPQSPYSHYQSEGPIAAPTIGPHKAHRRQRCVKAPRISATAQPNVARSVTENSALYGTTPAKLLSAQRGVLIASRHARKATADGYADFTPPDSRSRRQRVLLHIGRCNMRFILVNGRTPRPRSLCVMCVHPVGTTYLREVGTQLIYCDHDCYAAHCESAVRLLDHRAAVS